MDANGKGRRRRAIRRSILGVAVAWLALPVATTEAAPMRGGAMRGGLMAQEMAPPGASIALPGAWEAFLAGGPSTWSAWQSPPFTLPVRAALQTLISGDPAMAAASPLVQYFAWRRSLNPARFDRYHPFLGPRIPQGFIPPSPPPPVTPPSVPQVPTPPVVPPVPSVPPQVPEPSAFMVIAVGAAGAFAMRRRSRP